ncbi:hypothetical protein ABFX02_13G055300 [Erythranthe guttata]
MNTFLYLLIVCGCVAGALLLCFLCNICSEKKLPVNSDVEKGDGSKDGGMVVLGAGGDAAATVAKAAVINGASCGGCDGCWDFGGGGGDDGGDEDDGGGDDGGGGCGGD